MERSAILSTMSSLKLYGMKAAYDEILATAVKRQHEPERIVGDLLAAEISEKQARSIKYQMTIAKLPLAKDMDDFVFEGSPINQTLVRDLAGGNFLSHQRNCVLVGGTGTGKTHLAIAIARACSHASGRRSGDQFCVYVCDRLVLPTVRDRIDDIAAGNFPLDGATRQYVRTELGFRMVQVADGREALQIERLIQRGVLAAGRPLLNPLV